MTAPSFTLCISVAIRRLVFLESRKPTEVQWLSVTTDIPNRTKTPKF